ncbi:MAG: N-acetylmuramoyl-L-alanine amidase [Fibromonadales bacterium]|nr:N-acetylmuramoyl-L-alanine amidase [Fibromonadales bacterium]
MLKKVLFLFLSLVPAFAQDIVADLLVEKKDNVVYFDGIDLSKKMKMQILWQGDILQIGNSSWNLDNEWVSIKDASFLLQTPVQSSINGKKSFWFPLPSSLQVFERLLNKPIEYDSLSARIMAGKLKDIWSVNLESRNNGEVLELRFSRPFKTEFFYPHPNYIFRINGAAIDSTMFHDLAKKSSLITRVVPVQDAQSSQLTLSLRDNIEKPELIQKDGGKTIQIVLRKKQAPQTQANQPKAETPANTSGKKIKTIVIDPGHGGKDPGAIGYKSLQEKDVVLSVGLKLRKILEEKGFAVKMTRSTDEFIDLGKRPKMASDWGGDLFVSLHCNAIDGKERQQKTDGFKFYILRAGGSEEDKAIARRENQVVALETGKRKTEISPAEWIVLDNQLALYAEKSALLAGHLVEAFDGGSVRKQGTGAGQAGFMVLVGAYMPAVLAELGFITHPADGEFLATEKGQNELAERLANAILAFAK